MNHYKRFINYYVIPIFKITIALVLIALTSACNEKKPADATFYGGDSIRIFEKTIQLDFSVPTTATNIFISTDGVDPVPNSKCAYKPGDVIEVNRPTIVKLRYDDQGTTNTLREFYVIESGITASHYRNRSAVDSFENFILNHVNPAFGPAPDFNQTQTIDDGQGGTVTRVTKILGHFFPKGEQTMQFNNYKYYDADTDTTLKLNSGAIYGYRDDNGGYFNTDKNGAKLVVSGTFNGNADGNFLINKYSQVIAGYYRVFCSDRWCAPSDTYYVLDSHKEFVEINPVPNEKTISCH